MRTTATALMVLTFPVSFACADDFTLRNPAGETLGPFSFQEGTPITSLLAIASGAIHPGSFITGEVGAVVRAMPEVTPDGRMIDLVVVPRFTEEPTWEEYPAVLAVSGGQTTNVMCRKPVFPTHDVSASLAIYCGSTLVVGGGWPLTRTPEVMYVILHAEMVGPDGKPLPQQDDRALLRDPL